MTQVLIDRAVLEQLVEALPFYMHEQGVKEDFSAIKAITAGRAALANAVPTCTWSQDPDFEMGDTYHSACGEKWSFVDGGPAENRVKFCQGCGKPVKQIKELK